MENFTISVIKRRKGTLCVVEGLFKGTKKAVFATVKQLKEMSIDMSDLVEGEHKSFDKPYIAVCHVERKGDTFVALADSSRTKGQVLGANCPEGEENDPLYLKGQNVVREQDSIVLDTIVSKEVYDASF